MKLKDRIKLAWNFVFNYKMIAQDPKRLTRAQAIQAGYTLCGYADEEFQTLIKVNEVMPQDYHKPLMLAEKEGTQPKITKEIIAEVVADYMYSDFGEINSDVAEEIYNDIKAMDFSDMAEKINEKVKKHQVFVLTDIRLIP